MCAITPPVMDLRIRVSRFLTQCNNESVEMESFLDIQLEIPRLPNSVVSMEKKTLKCLMLHDDFETIASYNDEVSI